MIGGTEPRRLLLSAYKLGVDAQRRLRHRQRNAARPLEGFKVEASSVAIESTEEGDAIFVLQAPGPTRWWAGDRLATMMEQDGFVAEALALRRELLLDCNQGLKEAEAGRLELERGRTREGGKVQFVDPMPFCWARARCMAQVASALRRQGSFQKAIVIYEKSSSLLGQAVGRLHSWRVEVHCGMGDVMLDTGRAADALRLYSAARAICEEQHHAGEKRKKTTGVFEWLFEHHVYSVVGVCCM
jgi:hypothetical protein